jgi:HD-GYP domain-containing protein (c-di-GMP phosphodiesterase class II)
MRPSPPLGTGGPPKAAVGCGRKRLDDRRGIENAITERVESEQGEASAESRGAVIAVAEAAVATVRALERALELRDYRRGEFAETRDHCEGVTRVAICLAQAVAPELLGDPQLEHGFRLHDIGMLAVSDHILLKQGPLDQRELDEIREHPWLGERIVAGVPYLNGIARQVIGSHHEKWDGTGYPRGLEGAEIPPAARIFAIADAYDSMTSDQPYREALPVELALAEISDHAGSHFDPSFAEAFLALGPEIVAAAAAAHALPPLKSLDAV